MANNDSTPRTKRFIVGNLAEHTTPTAGDSVVGYKASTGEAVRIPITALGTGAGEGSTGPQGPAGPKGDNGNAGATGPQGPKGDTGNNGATGPQGIQGPAGTAGGKGDPGAEGPQGPKGDIGPQGIQGVQGIQGIQGPSVGTAAFGYGTGAGGAVTQLTSRTTGVTLSKLSGAITLFSKTTTAGLVDTFTVTNTLIAATDVVVLSVKSGTGIYFLSVSNVAAGSFKISVHTPAAVGSAEAPVINFAIIKAVTN